MCFIYFLFPFKLTFTQNQTSDISVSNHNESKLSTKLLNSTIP